MQAFLFTVIMPAHRNNIPSVTRKKTSHSASSHPEVCDEAAFLAFLVPAPLCHVIDWISTIQMMWPSWLNRQACYSKLWNSFVLKHQSSASTYTYRGRRKRYRTLALETKNLMLSQRGRRNDGVQVLGLHTIVVWEMPWRRIYADTLEWRRVHMSRSLDQSLRHMLKSACVSCQYFSFRMPWSKRIRFDTQVQLSDI